jgi:transcription initiation factor TFIID subunit TAF12
LDFNTELLHIKSTKDLSKEELNEVEIKLKEKFNQKLKDRISDDGFKRMASDNLTESPNIIEEEEKEEKEEEEVVLSVSNQKWTSETGKCPACGAPLSDSAAVCPDCGLSIK